VIGYDGSAASMRALDAAADLVGYGSTLAVVTVANGHTDGSATAEARERLHRRHVEARYHETRGDAAESLVEKAHELGADVLVVGRGDHAVGRVSSEVVRQACCDVLVVS
jgi:nucleotide-binding universal stress UspA family protein